MSPLPSHPAWESLDDEAAEIRSTERLLRRSQQLDRARALVRAAGLCGHCRHGLCYRVADREEPIVWCEYGMSSRRVPPAITECTRYQPEGGLTIPELARLAKVIEDTSNKPGHYW